MDTEEEKEQENINNISNDNIISSSLDIINKPIKKKERDDVEDEDFQSPSELSQPDSSHVNNDIVEMELKARSELEHFLTNKGIDATYANDFKIHVRRNKNKKSRESGSFTYSVTYSTAEGNLLTSKSEVVDSIKLNIKKTSRYSNVSGTEDMRQSSYEDALIATSKKLNSLPLQCHNIKIYNLGTVDLRPSFHNSVQIYPVGYKCEQSITSGSTSRGSSREQVVTCEIMDVEGDPEFIITVNATGQTYLAPSESLVWKKFDNINAELSFCPSFFNLEVELLIEGLEGAINCSNYKFHVERGYGSTYYNNDQSVTAKNTYLAKLDREKRTVERQKQKFDDKKDDTKESRPKRLSSDKSNQEVDKDEILKRKELKRQSIKLEKNLQKQNENVEKEKLKLNEKIQKEKLKEKEKFKLNLRKDLKNEIKKVINDCNLSVLEYFDYEEELVEESNNTNSNYIHNIINSTNTNNHNETSNENFNDLHSIITNSEDFYTNSDDINNNEIKLKSAGNLLELSCLQHIFNNLLNFQISIQLDDLVKHMNVLSKNPNKLNDKIINPILDSSTGTSISIMDQNKNVSTSNIVNAKVVDDDEEAEWNDDTIPINLKSNNNKSNNNDYINNYPNIYKSIVYFDRIQLCLMKSLRDSLQDLFELNDSNHIKFPLNQLTYGELSRMVLLQYLYKELEKSSEDIIHVIRGNKHILSKTGSKNIIRFIRYRMLARTKTVLNSTANKAIQNAESTRKITTLSNDLLSIDFKYITYRNNSFQEDIIFTSYLSTSNNKYITKLALENSFYKDDDIIQSLNKILHDRMYPRCYINCSKVLLKLLNMTQSKNLIWEVDRELYPDYYATICNPMTFVNVATNLVNKSYGEPQTDSTTDYDEISLAIINSFYLDTKQVLLNCITYNTELTFLCNQAQKLLTVLHRHTTRWIYSFPITRPHIVYPDIDECDDSHCLWTYRQISSTLKSIKCGRCMGIYSLDIIYQNNDLTNDERFLVDFLVIPTQEQLESNNEEWFCPLCVYEDSTLLKPLEPRDDTKSKHYVDEWGPSALIPWLLNKNHSNIIDDININSPHLILIVNALEVIINNGESMHWNTDQRTVVLLALFKVLQSNSKANEYLQSIHSNCEKLMKVSSKSTFREADFMKTVKLLCGEEGVAICRSYLDGISDNSELYQRIIEGRCIICKGTTFESDGNDENDENGEEKEDEIILCDGCDAEAHLRCLNLNEVPNRDWHCPSCAERIAKRESKQDCYVGNIEDHKRKDLEEDLIEKAINAKASGTAKTLDDAMNEMVCRYCGLSELDICSPLVIGQSREEHETHISSSRPAIANDVLPNLPNTSIKFSIDGVIQEPPAIAIPYLPLVNSPDGVKLVNLSQSLGCQPCIVHEHCALQMFQARLDRSRHTIRRRRKVIGDKAVSMAGISIKSLGRDNNYREYWKFPVSDDLFVTYDGPVDAEKKEFDRLIGRKTTNYSNESKVYNRKWKRISDTNVIRRIVEILDTNKDSSESTLRKQIMNYILYDRTIKSFTSKSLETSNDAIKSDESNAVEDPTNQPDNANNQSTANDNVPVALKLLKDKGVDVLSNYVIDEEDVFDDTNDTENVAEVDDISHVEYFSYSKKYFAIALVNKSEKRVKLPKGTITVTYQIHRQGIASPLAYSPLSDPWSDNIYYFSSINFKKSGKFTISFLIEFKNQNIQSSSINVANIKPLVYNVQVEAKNILCGSIHAIYQLNALKYYNYASRQINMNRNDLKTLLDDITNESEFKALQISILTLYAALPLGSLPTVDDENSKNSSLDEVTIANLIAESSNWSDILDQTWRGLVQTSTSLTILMECLLVLESFISKQWLHASNVKLLNALPLPHFAMKSISLSSIALRLFCLDKAILYEKLYIKPRQARVKRALKQYDEDDDDDDDDERRKSRRTRNTRNSNESSTNKRSRTSKYDDNDDEDNVISDNENDKATLSKVWYCQICAVENENRARSCVNCGEKKPPVSTTNTTTESKLINARRSTRSYTVPSKKRALDNEEAEFDENEMDEDDEENDIDDDEEDDIKKSYKRKNKNKRYNEDDDEDDDEDEDSNESEEDINETSYDNTDVLLYPYPKFDFDEYINQISNLTDNISLTEVKFYKILKELYDDERSREFWVAVDLKLNPKYKKIISQPMDLGKITNWIRSVHYYSNDHNAFAKDVRLVWENCMTFNYDSSELYQYAQQLSDIFEKSYKEYF